MGDSGLQKYELSSKSSDCYYCCLLSFNSKMESALCVFSSYFNLLICFQDSKLENETDISPIGTLTNYPIEIIIIIIIHSVNP